MTLADYEALRSNMVADEVAGYADLTNERMGDEDDDNSNTPIKEIDDSEVSEDDDDNTQR